MSTFSSNGFDDGSLNAAGHSKDDSAFRVGRENAGAICILRQQDVMQVGRDRSLLLVLAVCCGCGGGAAVPRHLGFDSGVVSVDAGAGNDVAIVDATSTADLGSADLV